MQGTKNVKKFLPFLKDWLRHSCGPHMLVVAFLADFTPKSNNLRTKSP